MNIMRKPIEPKKPLPPVREPLVLKELSLRESNLNFVSTLADINKFFEGSDLNNVKLSEESYYTGWGEAEDCRTYLVLKEFVLDNSVDKSFHIAQKIYLNHLTVYEDKIKIYLDQLEKWKKFKAIKEQEEEKEQLKKLKGKYEF